MKNFGKFFTAAAIATTAVACNNAPEADVEATDAVEVEEKEATETTSTYQVTTEGDEIHWVGFKTYADTEHNGTIQVKEGKLMAENGDLTGGMFVIDMTSIENEDLPEEGDYNKAKLVGHLQSEDFFYTEEYPEATFEITNVETAPEGNEKDATHMISGNLTMRGNTKNITIPANVEMNDNMVQLTTPEFVIDRTNWEVMYGSNELEGLAKEQLIDNSIKLEVDLEAKKA